MSKTKETARAIRAEMKRLAKGRKKHRPVFWLSDRMLLCLVDLKLDYDGDDSPRRDMRTVRALAAPHRQILHPVDHTLTDFGEAVIASDWVVMALERLSSGVPSSRRSKLRPRLRSAA